MAARTDPPLDRQEFADLMSRFAPFERAPHLAVACSGGPDSLALAVLAARWAARRSGRVTALVVDHGLRAGSAREAAETRTRLKRMGIPSVILSAKVPQPARDVQNAARALRYALMQDWCAGNNVLHLLVAHHREDQAETLMLRLGRGSGVDGLAAMAPETEMDHVRVLRPLLPIPRARLRATVAQRANGHIDDPSNRDPAFARVRIRALMPALAAEGLTTERMAATAGRLGRARAALEEATNALLGQAVGLYPGGYCRVAPAPLVAAPDEIALRALSRVVACVSGAAQPPRLDRIERLLAALRGDGAFRGRTLSGVRVAASKDAVLVMREAAAMAPPAALTGAVLWDGRFLCRNAARGWKLGALGAHGAAMLANEGWAEGRIPPRIVWPVLPAFWHRGNPKIVPHLGVSPVRRGAGPGLEAVFAPKRRLGAAIFNFS